ncbi:hypothetical protein Moror_10475 [Moniliophthora roreri MCA 2997]|uniref:Nudix hydrolase domain-containing protein n=2 Tax=Moniliophthora roreri TaxID=221103 RepID=V2WYB7_MONRO|nr:hypothetical protein Moror_10475 [Moniliophthora roreri MCA 2997]
MSAPKSQPGNLLRYHKKRRRVPLDPKEADSSAIEKGNLGVLTKESRQCLRTLASYHAPKSQIPMPRSRCAAVLVALFVGRRGDLYVLLSRRSSTLRTYAGDTSLPGGKVEPQDRSLEDTARREAFEEIGLPRDRRKVPLLCILEPFLAGNQLIVTPVVVLILDNTLQPILNHSEVTSLFSHPLASFISSIPPYPTEPEMIEVEYHTWYDYDWDGPPLRHLNTKGEIEVVRRQVRMHRFMTGREAGGIKPVFGLTAGMLIHTARIGFAREPDFELHPPTTPTMDQRIAWTIVKDGSLLKEALIQENIEFDLERMKKWAGVASEEDLRGSRRQVYKDKEGRPTFSWRKTVIPWRSGLWRAGDERPRRILKNKL